MNLDSFFDKEYNESKYNCAHFTSEVWFALTGVDISTALTGFQRGLGSRYAHKGDLSTLTRLEAPRSPCLALFQANRRNPHIGVFLVGKILHLRPSGVEWNSLDLVMVNFNRVRFYDVKKSCNC